MPGSFVWGGGRIGKGGAVTVTVTAAIRGEACDGPTADLRQREAAAQTQTVTLRDRRQARLAQNRSSARATTAGRCAGHQ